MLGDGDLKETQAVVKLSSSDTNAETEALSVSSHIVKEDFAVKSDEEEEANYTAVLGPPIELVPGPLLQRGFLPPVIGDDDGAEADAHFALSGARRSTNPPPPRALLPRLEGSSLHHAQQIYQHLYPEDTEPL